MAFIKNSVGLGGKNSPPDVSVIQWMLIRAQKFYTLNLFDAVYTLQETGVVDEHTGSAIKAVIKYRKSGVGFSVLTPQFSIGNFYESPLFPDAVIAPAINDENPAPILPSTPNKLPIKLPRNAGIAPPAV